MLTVFEKEKVVREEEFNQFARLRDDRNDEEIFRVEYAHESYLKKVNKKQG
jgi:hypothetical protein